MNSTGQPSRSLILSASSSGLLMNASSIFFSTVIIFCNSTSISICYFLIFSLCWRSHLYDHYFELFQFSSVAQSCPTLCNPMNRSTPGLPVHHQLLEFTQTHVHQVSDAIQPSHPLSSPSPLALNPSQHQSLFQWVNSAWGGQSTGVSALASFLPKKSQGYAKLFICISLRIFFPGILSYCFIWNIFLHFLIYLTLHVCFYILGGGGEDSFPPIWRSGLM